MALECANEWNFILPRVTHTGHQKKYEF